MNTEKLKQYVELLKNEKSILTRLAKYMPIPLFKIRIKKRLLLIDAEIEGKSDYLKTVQLHK